MFPTPARVEGSTISPVLTFCPTKIQFIYDTRDVDVITRKAFNLFVALKYLLKNIKIPLLYTIFLKYNKQNLYVFIRII